MEIIDRLKSMVGIGNVTIELSGLAAPLRAGGELRGTVTLRGGEYDATVEDIELHLDEERIVLFAQERSTFQHWEQRARLVIPMNHRVLGKGEVLALPVALALPADLEASDETRRYVVVAETEVPGLNPRHIQVVEVVA